MYESENAEEMDDNEYNIIPDVCWLAQVHHYIYNEWNINDSVNDPPPTTQKNVGPVTSGGMGQDNRENYEANNQVEDGRVSTNGPNEGARLSNTADNFDQMKSKQLETHINSYNTYQEVSKHKAQIDNLIDTYNIMKYESEIKLIETGTPQETGTPEKERKFLKD